MTDYIVMVDAACKTADAETLKNMEDAFMMCCKLEHMFWDQAQNMMEWPEIVPNQQDAGASGTNNNGGDTKLAPFNPSSETAQVQSMALMDLKANDILFDLGCGDGRLLIRAVSQVPGLRCIGVEMDPVFVERAHQAIAALPAAEQERIQVRCQDVTKILTEVGNSLPGNNDKALSDLTVEDATVIYLYLLPRGLQQIKPQLDLLVQHCLGKGRSLRVLAYTFSIQGWEPARIDTSTKSGVPIYLYEVLAEK